MTQVTKDTGDACYVAYNAAIVRRAGGGLDENEVLLPYDNERDPRAQAIWLPFKQRLQELGWIESRNIRFEYRLTGEEAESIRIAAKELVAEAPPVVSIGHCFLRVSALLFGTGE